MSSGVTATFSGRDGLAALVTLSFFDVDLFLVFAAAGADAALAGSLSDGTDSDLDGASE